MPKHRFSSGKADGGDATLVRPSNWNDTHVFGTASLSGNTALDTTYDTIFASGTITLTLPDATTNSGQPYTIKNVGTGVVTIATTASQTIDGALTFPLASKNQCLEIVSDGANWQIVPLRDVRVSFLQNVPLQEVALITSVNGTVTGTAGFGSSLFLQRMFIPNGIALTEVDVALGLAFAATSNGAGTLSQTFVLYSLGNSTSLGSVLSFSSSSVWATGTSTTAGAVSLTQFQGGWSGSLIHPMTFGSSSVPAGDYVVGHLLNFAQATSTWTVSLFGGNAAALSTTSVAAMTAINTTSTTAITTMPFGTLALRIQTSTSSSQSTTVTVHTGSSASGSASVISNVAAAALGTTTLSVGTSTLPNFQFIGTGSTTSNFPSSFAAGIMSTGANPAAITLTSTAVTYVGSKALVQPWFALVGA